MLYKPKTKYQQNKFLVSKTDSINKLKRKAILSSRNSKDLSKRIAELDSILNFYKKNAKDVVADILKKNAAKKNQQALTSNQSKRLARLNAIKRRNDSLKEVKKNRALEKIALKKKESARIAENRLRQKLRLDSIKIARARRNVKNSKDSTIIANKLKAKQQKNDSIKIALANTIKQRKLAAAALAEAKIKAKRKLDSTVFANKIRKSKLRNDSIRIAQAKMIAKRKQDSITYAVNAKKAQLRQDSIRIAQLKIAAKRSQDSAIAASNLRILQRRNDSIRIANARFLAKVKQDSIILANNTRRAQFKSDSVRIAKIEQANKRRLDSIINADKLRKIASKNDSIRIAKIQIESKRIQDSLNNANRLRNNLFKKDSIRYANARIAAKRRQDSISNAINIKLAAQIKADSIRVVQAKIIEDLTLKRKQDSIINSVAKTKIDDIFNKQDSTNVAVNNFNNNKNLAVNDSIDDTNLVNSDLLNSNITLDTMPYIRTGNILSKFVRNEINLKSGQIISNVLKVVNIGKDPIEFTTDLLIPGGWTRIDDANKKFVAKKNDTTIIPIIISPTKLINGNTEIIINSFLVGKQQQQLANNYFSLKTKKKVGWDIQLTNNQSVYLKNKENSKRFKFEIRNSGNNKQDLFVNYTIPRKDLFLSDTLGKVIEQPNVTFSLEAREKKLFDYIITFKDMNKRNYRRISYNNYNPNKVQDKKTHSLIINSSEPRGNKFSPKKRTKVNFIKLPNEVKANPYGYPYLPLTVLLSAQNVLSDRSFLALNLRGFKQISPTASLIYSTDLSYSNSYYTNNLLNDAPWYVGYFDDKKTIEIGQISGNLNGVSASGYGVKGSYRFGDMHEVGAFYVNSNGFTASNSSISYGIWHKFNYNDVVKVKTQLGKNINSISNRSVSVISFQPSIRLFNKHNITLTTSFTNKSMDNEPAFFESNGLLAGLSYNANFFKRRLKYTFNTRFNDKNFSFGNYDRLYLNQRTTFVINNRWSAFLSNNYQQSSNYNPVTGNEIYAQKSFFNNLTFTTSNTSGNYQTGLYYEYRNAPNNIIHNRGLTFRFSKYNFDKQFVNSVYIKAGYTKPELNNIGNKDYFNFELSSLTRYRTWNFNAKYNMGAFSTLTSQQALNDFITPQSIRISAQNQYLFPNRKLVLESNVIYSYNNVFSNQTLGVYPTIYFFNNSGWRFGMSANYTFSTRDFSSVYDNIDNQSGDQFNAANQMISSNFNLNFNLKKDFGIPIPFINKTAATATFVAFLDINGNGVKDNDETTLQNVVVQINKKEVLTDVNGEAVMKNILKDEYKFDAFSLENLNGWFPNIDRTIFIEKDGIVHVPFVRGVKVYGDVVLDRQKIAVSSEAPMDLSRIKVSATKGEKVYSALTNSEGRFEFYLPFGDYVLTMDEAILNNRLKISRNNIPLKLKSTQEGVYVSFYIIEKRRKVIFTDFTKKKN